MMPLYDDKPARAAAHDTPPMKRDLHSSVFMKRGPFLFSGLSRSMSGTTAQLRIGPAILRPGVHPNDMISAQASYRGCQLLTCESEDSIHPRSS